MHRILTSCFSILDSSFAIEPLTRLNAVVAARYRRDQLIGPSPDGAFFRDPASAEFSHTTRSVRMPGRPTI
jgi:hypothetical protein